jgi:hypothetical protein
MQFLMAGARFNEAHTFIAWGDPQMIASRKFVFFWVSGSIVKEILPPVTVQS